MHFVGQQACLGRGFNNEIIVHIFALMPLLLSCFFLTVVLVIARCPAQQCFSTHGTACDGQSSELAK